MAQTLLTAPAVRLLQGMAFALPFPVQPFLDALTAGEDSYQVGQRLGERLLQAVDAHTTQVHQRALVEADQQAREQSIYVLNLQQQLRVATRRAETLAHALTAAQRMVETLQHQITHLEQVQARLQQQIRAQNEVIAEQQMQLLTLQESQL